MNWQDIKRCFPKCPVKSIYQYRSDVFPVWYNFNGYGGSGHGIGISGMWNCVFTFAEIDPNEIADAVKVGGLMIYRGPELIREGYVLIYNDEFKVYKRKK